MKNIFITKNEMKNEYFPKLFKEFSGSPLRYG